jgi:flagellar motility protein MotE (MotC chaperone)
MSALQGQERTTSRRVPSVATAACLACLLALFAAAAPAQEDAVKLVEAKRLELKEKEESLKREEARLAALRKDVDEKIAAYTRLVSRVDALLARLERAEGDKIENVVKAYEIMPAEDAAVRLAALDNETALRIMTRMKSKKAGAIIAAMAPQKAAALTKSMARQATKPRQQ